MSKNHNKPPRDFYQETTDRIIEQLEAGAGTWQRPWHGRAALPLRSNGQPYKGTNTLLLWLSASMKGYTAPRWVTFQQALELGGAVRKGEKSTPVVFFKTWTPKDGTPKGDSPERETDGEESRKIPFLKQYHVFNAQQCDGLPAEFFAEPDDAPRLGGSLDDSPVAREFFDSIPAVVHHGGYHAFYSRADDSIRLPAWEAFRAPLDYVASRTHETIHWTAPRCGRSFGERFGDRAYAAEELVAELGAAFCLAALGLASQPREDHAQYLGAWLQLMREDKKAIFTAAHAASVAADYLLAFSAQQAPSEELPQLAVA